MNLYIGYAGFYFTRKSFNYVMPELVNDFGLDMADVGLLGMLFYIAYRLSKFFLAVYPIMLIQDILWGLS